MFYSFYWIKFLQNAGFHCLYVDVVLFSPSSPPDWMSHSTSYSSNTLG